MAELEITNDERLFLDLFLSLKHEGKEDRLLDDLLRMTLSAIQADEILLLDYHNENRSYFVRATGKEADSTLRSQELFFSDGLIPQVFMTKTAMAKIGHDEAIEKSLGIATETLMACPLVIGDICRGILLAIRNGGQTDGFSQAQLKELHLVANTVAIAYQTIEHMHIIRAILQRGSSLDNIAFMTNSRLTEQFAAISRAVVALHHTHEDALDFVIRNLEDLNRLIGQGATESQ